MDQINERTPMMNQWFTLKKQAGEALVFFRLGDFYELFHDDAVVASKALEITLTKRGNVPMCGIPHHQLDPYLDKLLEQDFKVAIAEQIEDPKNVKGIVQRQIVRFETKATTLSPGQKKEKAHSFIACFDQVQKRFGLSLIDVSSSTCIVYEFDSLEDLKRRLYLSMPSEIILSKKLSSSDQNLLAFIKEELKAPISLLETWRFSHKECIRELQDHFGIKCLDALLSEEKVALKNALGALLGYLKRDLCLQIDHIQEVYDESKECGMQIDPTTIRQLELFENQGKKSKSTLFYAIDRTKTAAGGRALRAALATPLNNVASIQKRQQQVEALGQGKHELFDTIADLERLYVRLVQKSAGPKELIALKESLRVVLRIKEDIERLDHSCLFPLLTKLDPLSELTSLLDRTLCDDAPCRLGEGPLCKRGVSDELDELYGLVSNLKEFLASYQTKLREELGIKTLKVGFTRAFGFYLEVTRQHEDKIPPSFTKRQTLVGSVRFISAELKSYEDKIYRAEEKIRLLETSLYESMLEQLRLNQKKLFQTAFSLSTLDVLYSFATLAKEKNYVKPEIDESTVLEIIEGRHPVVEQSLPEPFQANDINLSNESLQMMLLTGPNMSGKSTYIRQVALIAILAHTGSFVPAKSARIGLIDKVFSRIGASDDLAAGKSTFMCEMTETGYILRHCTERSLIILDEIGRGTSTFDGIAIAYSCAEYLLSEEGKQAKTLFATHYFELTKLAEHYERCANYNVSVYEGKEGITFLRKIVPGSSDKSYGIHVAKLAGLPPKVLHLAKNRLEKMEKRSGIRKSLEGVKKEKNGEFRSKELQLSLF